MVDIVCDKTLHMFYEGAEVPRMAEDILKENAVKLGGRLLKLVCPVVDK